MRHDPPLESPLLRHLMLVNQVIFPLLGKLFEHIATHFLCLHYWCSETPFGAPDDSIGPDFATPGSIHLPTPKSMTPMSGVQPIDTSNISTSFPSR